MMIYSLKSVIFMAIETLMFKEIKDNKMILIQASGIHQ